MKRALLLAALLATLTFSTGCVTVIGSMVAGVIAALTTKSNDPPAVTIGAIARTSGAVTIPVSVADANNDAVTLAIDYRTGNGAFVAATATGTTVTGSRDGTAATVTWDAETDLGSTAYVGDVEIRITPADPSKTGKSATSAAFAFGNDAPAVALEPIASPQGNTVTFVCTLSDSSSDPVDLTVEFERADEAGIWRPATLALTPDSITAVATQAGGRSYLMAWDAAVDIVQIPAYRGPAKLRVTANDGLPSAMVESNSFETNQNNRPAATFASNPFPPGPFGGSYGGTVRFDVQFSDAETDFVSVDVQYSTDGGSVWMPATLTGQSTGFASGFPGSVTHEIKWNSTADLPNFAAAPVRLRVRARDDDFGNFDTLTADFTLDNQSTNTPPTITVNGAGATEISAGVWQVFFASGTALPAQVTIAASDADSGDTIDLSATFDASDSSNYAALPAELQLTPAPVGSTSSTNAVAPAAATITIDPNGTLSTVGVISFDLHAQDGAANEANEQLRIVVGDATAPTFSGAVSAVAVSPFAIELRWAAASDDVSPPSQIRYRVYRHTSSPVPTTIPAYTTDPGVTRFTAGGLIGNTQYFFIVRAVDQADNEGNNATTVTATTPAEGTHSWTGVANLGIATRLHVSVVLADGRVLVAGGDIGDGIYTKRCEIFDPHTNAWTPTSDLNGEHASANGGILLPDGRVCVVGGEFTASVANAAELFDPATGQWTPTSPPSDRRRNGRAVLLHSGKVFVMGGIGNAGAGSALSTCEELDPATNTWTPRASMAAPRYGFVAVVLPDSRVCVLGGHNGTSYSSTVEMYDPGTNSWSNGGTINAPRAVLEGALLHDGRILLVGGDDASGITAFAEVFDPATGTSQTVPNMAVPRDSHRLLVLPNGRVLIAGGRTTGTNPTAAVELFDPNTNTFTTITALPSPRLAPGLCMLVDGRILLTGGQNAVGNSRTPACEIYDPARGAGTTRSVGTLGVGRIYHSTILLPTGKVLCIGGFNNGGPVTNVDLYDPATEVWTPMTPLPDARSLVGATLLADGRVLIACGRASGSTPISTGYIFDPVGNSYSASIDFSTARMSPGTALLPTGEVLLAGGTSGGGSLLTTSQIYTPATNSVRATGALNTGRWGPRIGFRRDGRVIVATHAESSPAATCELFDPATEQWTATASLGTARIAPGGATLANGHWVVAGGTSSNTEIFDGSAWANSGAMPLAMEGGMIRLPSGRLLFAGGFNSTSRPDVLVFDPISGTWAAQPNLPAGRHAASFVELASGEVLIVSGRTGSTELTSCLLFNEGLGYSGSDRPRIDTIAGQSSFPVIVEPESQLTIAGARFRAGEAPTVTLSGPLGGLSSLYNEEFGNTWMLPATNWASGTTLQCTLPSDPLPPGYYMLRVMSGGMPSIGHIIKISSTPKVAGVARYLDVNKNGICDAGDQIIVPFSVAVRVNGATIADFALPVAGDGFGTGASIAAGPAINEVSITLGAGASLKTRQTFDTGSLTANSPSGINIAGAIASNVIESLADGSDAVASTPIDIVPAFVDSGQSVGNAATFSLAVGDLDSDGDADVVTINESQASKVWLNDGNGVFAVSAQSISGATCRFAALGDVDGDGDLDLLIAKTGGAAGQANEVWLNDGAASFTNSGQSLGSSITVAVALGDVDGDGDLDFVAGNSAQQNRLWLNNGSGVFSDSGQNLETYSTAAVALGDVDGDGDLDILFGCNAGQANRLWLNNGAGVFSDSGQALGSANTNAIAVCDVDGDGDLDFIAGNGGQPVADSNRVWLNNGAGVFTDSGQSLGSDETLAVVAFDIDGDGDTDIVCANGGSAVGSPNTVWLNDGAGVFSPSGQSLGNVDSYAVQVADFDRDGDFDVVFASPNNPSRIYANSLAGTWGTATFADSGQTLGNNPTKAVALGDFDRDGDLDLIEANDTDASRIWLNDGAGAFSDSGQTVATLDSRGVGVVDFDRDGDLDAIITNQVGEFKAYRNDGTGTMTQPPQGIDHASAPLCSDYGDIDGDGDIDVVSGSAAGQNLCVFVNNGTGTYSMNVGTGTENTRGIVLIDVDGDGDLDLVRAVDGAASYVMTNNGSGSFSAGQSLLNAACSSVARGDVDGDGDVDLVFGVAGAANQVWLNSAGTFSDSGQSLGNADTRGVWLADFDGDGDLDLFAVNHTEGSVEVWLNDGTGVFGLDQSINVANAATISIADLDRDGDLDLVIGADSGANQMWRNE